MLVLNFAHPLTSGQVRQIEKQVGRAMSRIVDATAQFTEAQSFIEQAHALVESVGLSSEDWQQTPLLINLPSLNVIAALVLAELHGRIGHFPAILRIRAVAGAAIQEFEVAEIVNLQAVRDTARHYR